MENTGRGVDVGVDGARQTVSRRFDWNETPPSVAVVRLLSVARNCDPMAIDPLGESVDPDALDRLLPSMDGESKLEFTHRGHSVHLYGDGRATVELDGH